MDSTLTELEDVFRNVFDDDSIELTESTTAHDVEGWDSMMHINLIVAIEKRLGIRFTTSEVAGLKANGQNVGNLVRLVDTKRSARGAGRG